MPAACSAHAACAHDGGDCCPTTAGHMLRCCSAEPPPPPSAPPPNPLMPPPASSPSWPPPSCEWRCSEHPGDEAGASSLPPSPPAEQLPAGCTCSSPDTDCLSGDQDVRDRCGCERWLHNSHAFCYVVRPDECPGATPSAQYGLRASYRDCDLLTETLTRPPSPAAPAPAPPAPPASPAPPLHPPRPSGRSHCRYVCSPVAEHAPPQVPWPTPPATAQATSAAPPAPPPSAPPTPPRASAPPGLEASAPSNASAGVRGAALQGDGRAVVAAAGDWWLPLLLVALGGVAVLVALRAARAWRRAGAQKTRIPRGDDSEHGGRRTVAPATEGLPH